MKRVKVFVGIMLFAILLSACKKTDYGAVIDKVISYNHEVCEKYYNDSGNVEDGKYWATRDNSDFTVWEDNNNYYVLIQKSYEYNDKTYTCADGYKIGKNDESVSSSPDDRSSIVSYYEENESPVYNEKNVSVDSKSIESDMR